MNVPLYVLCDSSILFELFGKNKAIVFTGGFLQIEGCFKQLEKEDVISNLSVEPVANNNDHVTFFLVCYTLNKGDDRKSGPVQRTFNIIECVYANAAKESFFTTLSSNIDEVEPVPVN